MQSQKTVFSLRGSIIEALSLLVMKNGQRRVVQAMDWSPEGKRKRGRPRKNWQETTREDIRCMDMTWSEAIDLSENRD